LEQEPKSREGVRNASLCRALLGVEKAVIEDVELDPDEGMVAPSPAAATCPGTLRELRSTGALV
jgi:hypothetical protein